MNVNLLQPTEAWPLDSNIWAQLQDSVILLEKDDTLSLTGNIALITDTKALLPGVFRVWFETDADAWVWIDADGVQHESPFPAHYDF